MPETVPELVLLSGRTKSIVGIGSPVALQKNVVDEPRFRATVDPDEGEVKLMEGATVGMCVQRRTASCHSVRGYGPSANVNPP